MPYDYTLPTTGAFYFASRFKECDARGLAILTAASTHRAQLRDSLKKLKRSDDKDTLGIIKILEDYLPLLFTIYHGTSSSDPSTNHDDDVVANKDLNPAIAFRCDVPLVTSWRSTFSDHRLIPGKAISRLDLPGLENELIFVLLTHVYSLSQYAGHLSSHNSQRSIELLCKAAGVLDFLPTLQNQSKHNMSSHVSSGNPKSPDFPEGHAQLSTCLMEMTLADAQMLAISRLLQANESSSVSNTKGSTTSMLCRLSIGSADRYAAALGILSSHAMHKQITSSLKAYITLQQSRALGHAYLFLGTEQAKSGNVGFAITCARHAEGLFGSDKTDDRQRATSLLRKWTKENQHVTFQSIESLANVQAKLPSGRDLVRVTPFKIPNLNRGPVLVEDKYAGSGGYY